MRNSVPTRPFEFQPTNHEAVYSLIQSLNNCGAGLDGLSTKLLKLICPDIVPYLTHLFNLCLSQGTFPSSFKRAIVVPIFKSGDRFSFNNYRPIALLPVLSKILEKIAFSQLSSFLTEEELLYPKQFGFRKNHSTYMPISLLFDCVTRELKKKQCVRRFIWISAKHSILSTRIFCSRNLTYVVFKISH